MALPPHGITPRKVIPPTVRRVPHEPPEYDKHIVHVQLAHDLVGAFLRGRHGLADARDVSVVPSVVVHYHRSIRHRRYLVAVVPPRHHFRILKEFTKVSQDVYKYLQSELNDRLNLVLVTYKIIPSKDAWSLWATGVCCCCSVRDKKDE